MTSSPGTTSPAGAWLIDRSYCGSAMLGYLFLVCCMARLSSVSGVKNITHGVARHLRSIGFPDGSGMGIFFALGVPIDIPNKSVLFSMYFEANYGLPGEWNSSYYLDEPYYRKRSLDRRTAYNVLVNKLESFGYSGEACLLKMICEVASCPLTNNGVFGDILHILFTMMSKCIKMICEVANYPLTNNKVFGDILHILFTMMSKCIKMICEVANYPLTNNGVFGDILHTLFTPSSSQDEGLPSTITEAEYREDCDSYYEKCPQSPLALISQNLDANT